MSDRQNPSLSGDEPSLGGESIPQLTGREPGLGSVPKSLVGLTARVQVRMAETLARTGNPAARQFLRQVLLEGDEQVIQAAARILGQVKDPQALDALAEVIQNTDLEAPARSEALKAVGQIGGRLGLSILLDAENDPDSVVREARIRALGDLGARFEDEDSRLRTHVLEALHTAFDDDDPTVREVSVVMIGWVGGEESYAILLRALHNPHREVIRAAARLLPPDYESQEQQTYLQNLRRYHSTLRQALHLAGWLVRESGCPTLIQTLILALVTGVVSYYLINWAKPFVELVIEADPVDRLGLPISIAKFILVAGIPTWLFAMTIEATERHHLNERYAVIRITDLNKSILLISYMLASLHRLRVWFVLMASALIGWAVTGYAMQAWLVTAIWFGLGVLTVPLGVIYTLPPRRPLTVVRDPKYITGIRTFILLLGLSGLIILISWRWFKLLVFWAASSLVGTLALLSICLLIDLAVVIYLLNRFKRWS